MTETKAGGQTETKTIRKADDQSKTKGETWYICHDPSLCGGFVTTDWVDLDRHHYDFHPKYMVCATCKSVGDAETRACRECICATVGSWREFQPDLRSDAKERDKNKKIQRQHEISTEAKGKKTASVVSPSPTTNGRVPCGHCPLAFDHVSDRSAHWLGVHDYSWCKRCFQVLVSPDAQVKRKGVVCASCMETYS